MATGVAQKKLQKSIIVALYSFIHFIHLYSKCFISMPPGNVIKNWFSDILRDCRNESLR